MTDEQSPGSNDGPPDEVAEQIQAAVNKWPSSQKDREPERFGIFHPVYQVLYAIRWSRFVKKLPVRILNPVDYVLHVIQIHDSYTRKLRGEGPFSDPFGVRPGQHATMPTIFLVELFPPSKIDNLRRACRKNKWNDSRIKPYPELEPALEEARSGQGLIWWRLGAVKRRKSSFAYPDGAFGRLPRKYAGVELKAFQIGQGLTAVMARIDLSEKGASKLDEVWHRLFLPKINWGKWGGAWPQAQDAKWTAFRRTQEARGAIHKEARRWLRKQCPGVFASNGYPQPLIDVLLFEGLDATFNERTDPGTNDALRALGLSASSAMIERTDQLPAMAMTSADKSSNDSRMEGRGTWSLWGGRSTVYEALSEPFKAYGLQRRDSSVAYWIQKAAESYFIRLSISELLTLSQMRYASMRDSALRSHRRYRMKRLKQLRSDLLSQSLDLSTIDRDVRQHNKPGWRIDRAKFTYDDAPWAARNAAEQGFPTPEPINLNKLLIKRQNRMLKALAVADRNYREILTSAASLTSSMRALRTGTVALWVALASLTVTALSLAAAVLTLVLTGPPKHSEWHVIVQFIHTHFPWITQWFST